jgi:hypothetical protein
MKLFPSRPLDLPEGVRVQPSLVEGRVLAAHVMKHVVGLSTSRQRGPWNAEGFTDTMPPVIDEARRGRLLLALQAEEIGCLLPEARGERGGTSELECYVCERDRFCAPHLAETVGGYLGLAEQLLASFEDGVSLSSRALTPLLVGYRSNRLPVESLATLAAFQNEKGQRILRATRVSDGLRVELLWFAGSLRFRTVYRLPGPLPGRVSAVLDTKGFRRVSDRLTVPRPFAEACGLPLPDTSS